MKSSLLLIISLSLLTACATKHHSTQSKPQGGQDAEKKAQETFGTHFKTTHPGREVNDEFLKMGVEYGAYLGLNLNSPAARARLEHDLNAVVAGSASAASSQWLFRGTFHVTTLTNSFTEIVYGIATMAQNGGGVKITSNPGKADIHFDGITRDGRLSGTMDISAGPVVCNAKVEGSLVPNRISLDCQGENANEMVRGSFVFLR